jgi:hypothetical protein
VTHTQTHGRASLDERSARRGDLYLTAHNTHKSQRLLPSTGFKPADAASERPQACVLDHAVTTIGSFLITEKLSAVWQSSRSWVTLGGAPRKLRWWSAFPLGACTHTGKTGAGPNSGAGCNVNKWMFSQPAGPAELPFRQLSVPDLNSTRRAPGRRLACQFQCNCTGTCTCVWTCRCRKTVLKTSVCMKPTRC